MTCTVCEAKSDTFLCHAHTDKLRSLLKGLSVGPELQNGHRGGGWVIALLQAAYGQTSMGESVRRSSDRGSPALCRLNPNSKCDADDSFKNTPGELLDDVRNFLTTWIRDICETRGVECELDRPSEIAMSAWLHQHVNAIAIHPAADEFYDELEQRIREIERMINRPEPQRDLGACPAMVAGRDGERECRKPLTARKDQDEIRCPGCDTTYHVETLIRQHLDDVRYQLWSAPEVLHIMASIGEPIAERTWRKWRAEGRVQSRNEWDSEPKYLISEVREVWARTERHKRTSEDKVGAVV